LPSTEENANTKISTVSSHLLPSPNWCETAAWVSVAPATPPGCAGSYTERPPSMMMNAVAVHTTNVSTNTPSDWIRPCFTGCEVSAVAAAFGALPIPASFENRPRFTPLSSAEVKPPAAPAAAGPKPKASLTMSPNTPGIAPMLVTAIASASSRYSSAMAGSTYSATLEMRRTPPKMAGVASAISTSAVQRTETPCAPCSTSATVFACTMLNATPNVKTSSTANTTPQRREPSPRSM
jgi:hypothetical protein